MHDRDRVMAWRFASSQPAFPTSSAPHSALIRGGLRGRPFSHAMRRLVSFSSRHPNVQCGSRPQAPLHAELVSSVETGPVAVWPPAALFG